jgi:hypothetical protein
MNKQKLIKAIGIFAMLAAFVFIIKTFLSFDMDYANLLSPACMILIPITALCTCLSVAFSTHCWGKSMSFFSHTNVRFEIAFPTYTKANLGKYLPGNVGHYAGRQFFGASLGFRQSYLAFASILEILYNAGAAFFISVIPAWDKISGLLQVTLRDSKPVWPFLMLLLLCCMILSVYLIFRKTQTFGELLSFFRSSGFRLLILRGILFSALGFFMLGITLALFINVTAPLELRNIPLIIATGAGSWLIGFITPGVPGGIGVRETVLVLMLSPVFPKEAVLTAAVLQRFAMIVGDVLAWALGELLVRIGEKKKSIL